MLSPKSLPFVLAYHAFDECAPCLAVRLWLCASPVFVCSTHALVCPICLHVPTGGGSASRSGENHGSSSQLESAPLDWSAPSDGGFGEAGPGSEANERRPLEASLPLSPYPMPLYHATNSLNLPPVFLGPHDPLLDYLSVFDQSGDSNGSGGGDEDHDRNPSPTDDRASVSSSLTASSQPQPPSFSSASGPAQPPHAGGGGQAHPSQAVFRPWALARQLSGGPSGGPPPRPPAFQRSSTSSSGHPPMGGFLEPGSRPTGPPLLVRTTSSGYSLSLSLPGRSGSYLSDSGGGGGSVGSIGSSMSREDLLAAIPLVPGKWHGTHDSRSRSVSQSVS